MQGYGISHCWTATEATQFWSNQS